MSVQRFTTWQPTWQFLCPYCGWTFTGTFAEGYPEAFEHETACRHA